MTLLGRLLLLALILPAGMLCEEQQHSPADPSEIARLQSADMEERAVALMMLRRPEATAAIPALLNLLGSEAEFPQKLLVISSQLPVTQSSDSRPTFGGEAAETLARIGCRSDELLALLTNGDWRIRANAARALGGLHDGRAAATLMTLLAKPDEHWQVRGNAALALGIIGDLKAVRPLVAALPDPNHNVRAAAVTALGRLKSPDTLDPLVRMLDDPVFDIRRNAAGAIGQIGGAASVDPLIRAALHDGEQTVREVATSALGRTRDPRAIAALAAALQDSYINVRINAARGLGHLREAGVVDALILMLSDSEPAARQAAADALGEIGDRRAVDPLVRMVLQENGREWVIQVLRGLDDLARLGHRRAAEMLQRYRPRLMEKEWWDKNKAQLLEDN